MGDITTIGLDLAKNVFQVHAVDVAGSVVLRKRLRRGQVLAFFAGLPPCLIGLEACATAHHWARELIALGHETRLMPPSYVKAYVKRNKHDVADAEAICEAVRRPGAPYDQEPAVHATNDEMRRRLRCQRGTAIASGRMAERSDA
jgi:transposase